MMAVISVLATEAFQQRIDPLESSLTSVPVCTYWWDFLALTHSQYLRGL